MSESSGLRGKGFRRRGCHRPCWQRQHGRRQWRAGQRAERDAISVSEKGGGWRPFLASDDRSMRIEIVRPSRATIVAPTQWVLRGVPRSPAGPFGAPPTPSAGMGHLRIGTVRVGMIEQGS
jgi:hypothetical protein